MCLKLAAGSGTNTSYSWRAYSRDLFTMQLCIFESEKKNVSRITGAGECLLKMQFLFIFLPKQPGSKRCFDYEILCICFRQEKRQPDINQSVLLNCTLSSQKVDLSLGEANLNTSHFFNEVVPPLVELCVTLW